MSAIATLKALLGMDVSQYVAGMREAEESTDRFQKKLRQVGAAISSAFTIGALAAFGRESLQFAAQWQDVADQFGISASEARGFSRAISEVGGNSERALSILRKVQEYQEKIGDTKNISDFINAMRESYQRTGDLGTILEVVGGKHASIFAAALSQMSGGLEQFKDATQDATSAMADYYSESTQRILDDTKSTFATLIVAFSSGWRNIAALARGGTDAMMKEYYDQERAINDVYDRMEKRQKAEAAAREKHIEEAKRKPFADAFSKLSEPAPFDEKTGRGLGLAELLYKSKPAKAFRNPLQDEIDRRQEELKAVRGRTSGSGAGVDSLAAIGGMVGGDRPMLGVADRQLQIMTESTRIQREIEQLTRQMNDALQQIRESTVEAGE